MARTKQTARRSTGGKGYKKARKKLQILSARKTSGTQTFWRMNGKTVRDGNGPSDGASLIDFRTSSLARSVDRLWPFCGREDIEKIRYVASSESFIIKYRGDANNRAAEFVATRREADTLLGKHNPSFVATPRAKVSWFDDPRLSRLALPESLDDSNTYDDCIEDPDWVIECVWLSDGSNDENEACYYARGEGSSSKHQIDLYTMSFDRLPPSTGRRSGFNSLFGKAYCTREDAILGIDNWCIQNIGRERTVNRALSRSPAVLAPCYLDRSIAVPYQDNTILCLRSAVCNAMALLVDRQAADRLWCGESTRVRAFEREHGYEPSVHHFTHVQQTLRNHHPGTITLDHVRPPPGANIYKYSRGGMPHWRSEDVGRFLELAAHNPAMYVLRINDVHHRQHAICVDARSPAALIYDCAEEHAMRLTDTSFRLCCPAGDPSKFQSFDDVRLVRATVKQKKDRDAGDESARKRVRRSRHRSAKPQDTESAKNVGSASH